MSNEHDDEVTRPDIPVPRHRADDEPPDDATVAIIGIITGLHRATAALERLAIACPTAGSPGRERGLEILALAFGEGGDLHHETRRGILALIREEREAIDPDSR
jgi:hypothetical protein